MLIVSVVFTLDIIHHKSFVVFIGLSHNFKFDKTTTC